MKYESKAHAALVGLVTGALQKLAKEQPIVGEVNPSPERAEVYVTFNGDERYLVKVEPVKVPARRVRV